MLLSIIIPVFNESQLVTQLLDRVRAVNFGAAVSREILIVDDGSTDGTIDLLQAYVKKHSVRRDIPV